MVKKNDDESKDLTRIEDLSEFLHQDDEGLDSKFNHFDSPSAESSGIKEISQLLNETPVLEAEELLIQGESDFPESLPEGLDMEMESSDEILDANVEPDFGSTDFGELESLDDIELPNFEDNNKPAFSYEPESEFTSTSDISELENELMTEEESSESINETPLVDDSERFLDVKTFAQNFSYGKSNGVGGNPPYSLIARNIKFKDEARDILDLLSELGLVNSNNEKEINRSLELGSLLIPQISEYAAIVLAHKLRRFDLDLEVGLTDEVHPSKSGEINPRGLIKKENIRQNRSERQEIAEFITTINDILMTTSPALPGYMINDFLGVKTTFTIIEETELEKLQYVQSSIRNKTALVDFENSNEEENTENFTTPDKAFSDYNDNFILVYDDLLNQLKQKALILKANALLGINYQVTPMHFDKSHKMINAYQVTCSATFAFVSKENA